VELGSWNLVGHVGMTVVGAVTQNLLKFVSRCHMSVMGHNMHQENQKNLNLALTGLK